MRRGNHQYAFYTGAVICLIALDFDMLARRPAESRLEPMKAAA